MKRIWMCAALGLLGCDDAAKSTEEDAGADAAPPVDAAPEPTDANVEHREISEACEGHHQCASGWCIEARGTALCTKVCPSRGEAGQQPGDCPEGWACRVVETTGGDVSVCHPPDDLLCVPCRDDDDCPSGACYEVEPGTSVCGLDCSADDPVCPLGFGCRDGQCKPETDSCTCNLAASIGEAGRARRCATENAVGICIGREVCGEDGWAGCDAPTAVEEVCNGLDDNCDGRPDNVELEVCTQAFEFEGRMVTCPGRTRCTEGDDVETLCDAQPPGAELCNFRDDDCDLEIDEDFPLLDTQCESGGMGACQNTGFYECAGDGSGAVCNAAEGQPVDEACDGIDNDCDGSVDEDFADVNTLCELGVGLCARQGVQVCANDGLSAVCGAQPGDPAEMDLCDLQDDDCDGEVDEDFVDEQDRYIGVHDCGRCGVDCDERWPDALHIALRCEAVGEGAPGCTFDCLEGFLDQDGSRDNGCEVEVDPGAVYVSVEDGVDGDACGEILAPCASITVGIQRAQADEAKLRVRVADGIYRESVDLVDGISVLGGHHRVRWAQDPEASPTVIEADGAPYAVSAVDITGAVTDLDGFTIFGPSVLEAGNSYGVYISGSNGMLRVRHNRIFAGGGGQGVAGRSGDNGAPGVAGAPGNASAHREGAGVCSPDDPAGIGHAGGRGGQRDCGGVAVHGGDGGGARACPGAGRQEDGGGAGVGGGGAGGVGAYGYRGALLANGDQFDACVPSFDEARVGGAGPGLAGVAGGDGAGADGAADGDGSVEAGHWRGATGGAGDVGQSGHGGGGGAGSAGVHITHENDADDVFDIGASGGGGGSGACGANGGAGGGPGGGSFAVFVAFGGEGPGDAGAFPVIEDNDLTRGRGGRGGRGGNGGVGGGGGEGGAGGAVGDGLFLEALCAFEGGQGGPGGRGGHGGGGGGGAGGASYDLLLHNHNGNAPDYEAVNDFPRAADEPTGGGAGEGGGALDVEGGLGRAGAAGRSGRVGRL